jgi:hypothetical protein
MIANNMIAVKCSMIQVKPYHGITKRRGKIVRNTLIEYGK